MSIMAHKKTKTSMCIITAGYQAETSTALEIPLLSTYVAAGFPSPADDHFEETLDLNSYLITHPAATFFVRVEGESMINAGIRPGDMLVVDRSLPIKENAIVIAYINGEFTVKRIATKQGRQYLCAENEAFAPIAITKEMDIELWGVVSYVIHKAT